MSGPSPRPRSGPNEKLLIDEVLPSFDVTQRRHAVVDATPERAYDAVRELDLLRLGVGPWLLNQLRLLPAQVLSRLRGEAPPRPPASMTFDDVLAQPGWVTLGERPGAEFVIGAVGRFWEPEIEWLDVEADEFATFDRPGYAKLAVGVSVRPYGADRSLVTYEARTATTDAASRRRFRRYWTLVGPFAGYLMGRVLTAVAREVRGRRVPIEAG